MGARETEVDLCPGCRGLWLDLGELTELVRRPLVMRGDLAAIRQAVQTLRTQRALAPAVYRPCPICGEVMHRRNFGRISGVIVDECGRHGAFFDAGELEAVQEFVRLGGMELTEKAEREELQRRERARGTARAIAAHGMDQPGGQPRYRGGEIDLGETVGVVKSWFARLRGKKDRDR